ncbi:MAG: hypothetical protein CMF74_12615 [Maricaulis sp.]|nr:hypothetical protein [Maricaulis sp.]
MSNMEHPVLVFSLRTDSNIPIDMPDDFAITALQIAGLLNQLYNCGVEVGYGSATHKYVDDILKHLDLSGERHD